MHCASCHAAVSEWGQPCAACGSEPRIEGRWVLLDALGEGASGTTWRARDTVDGGEVAVKELAVRRARSIKAIELFEREARALEQLDHPGIPDFIADVTVEGPGTVSLYLVQELIDGDTLTIGRADEPQALETVAELCDILGYLHDRRPPIIHRDIKPSNVMRRRSGGLVLIDFGSVRHAVRDAALGGSTVAGTFGYMPPEQLRGIATPASDLYAVGALALALLSGRDAAELVDPVRPSDWRRDVVVSDGFAWLLDDLLAPDHTERLGDARDVATRARQLLDAPDDAPDLVEPEPAPAPPTDGPPPARRPPPDAHATVQLMKREMRALRRLERWAGLSNHTIGVTLLMCLPIGALASAGLGALARDVGADISGFQIGAVLAALAAVWLVSVPFRRAHARARHPWRRGALSEGLLRLWPGTHDFEPRLRAALMGRLERLEHRERDIAEARRRWKDDPRLIPLLEALAWSHHQHRRYADAADALAHAQAIGEASFGGDDILHLDQLARYATLSASATEHEARAVAQRKRAEEGLIALEAREQADRGALVARAIDELHAEAGASDVEPPERAARRRRAFRWRVRRHTLLPGRGRWNNLPLLLVLGGMAGAFLGLLLAVAASALGAFGPPPIEDPPFGWFMLAGGLTPAALGIGVGLAWPSRLHVARWRDLYPDLDRVWPAGHPDRPHVVEALERAWRDPIAQPKASSEAIVRLEKHTNVGSRSRLRDGIQRLLAGEHPRDLGERPADDDDPPGRSAAQALELAELHTLRSWYDAAIVENVASLDALPVAHRERRARLYEIQAHRALGANLEAVAEGALRQAERLRGEQA